MEMWKNSNGKTQVSRRQSFILFRCMPAKEAAIKLLLFQLLRLEWSDRVCELVPLLSTAFASIFELISGRYMCWPSFSFLFYFPLFLCTCLQRHTRTPVSPSSIFKRSLLFFRTIHRQAQQPHFLLPFALGQGKAHSTTFYRSS